MTWILILALYSPGGDLVESQSFVMPTQEACRIKSQTWRGRDPMGLRRVGICVSRLMT